MRDPLSKKVQSIEPSGIRKFFDIVSEMKDAISLGVGEPDFDTPWHIREEGIYSLEKGRTFYTSNAGLKDLKIEIHNYLERRCNICYDPDHEIMVTVEDSLNTYEYDKHFIVYPQMVWSESRRAVPTGKRVPEGFSYSSGNNTEWLSVEQIRELLKTIDLEK